MSAVFNDPQYRLEHPLNPPVDAQRGSPRSSAMAYYLDSTFDSFTSSFQPTSAFDDPSSLLSAPDFDLDATIFSDPGPIPTRTSGPSSYTHFPEPLQSLHQAPYNPLNSSTSSNSYALYDPDSPFNSPAGPASMPVKGLTKDGRLKTKLMGIGSGGGFLTSPLIVSKPRMGKLAPPEIAIESPAATPQATMMTPADSFHGSEQMRTTSSDMAPSMSIGSSANAAGFATGGSNAAAMSASSSRAEIPVQQQPSGLGMGISGVPDLATALEMGDYGNPNLKIFAMPKNVAVAKDGECDFLPYPDHMPTTTLGRGKNNVVDVGSGAVDERGDAMPARSPNKFVEHQFARSPPLANAPLPPATHHRPVKTFPHRTINKAKSCSALSASAKRAAQSEDPLFEPLTPVSAHTANFLVPGVPFNSPTDGITQIDAPSTMPFSFADLYNLDLSVDNTSADDLDSVKKSPYQFAHELLSAENGAGLGAGVGLGMGMGGAPANQDFSMLQAIPTPYGAGPGSAFSSPSTPYLSDPSPELGLAYHSANELTSAEMLSATSIDSTFSLPPSGHSSGRQRCATYGGVPTPAPHDSSLLDPNLLSPQHQPRQRQLSAQAAYGAGPKNFSYPTRLAAQPQPQPQHSLQPPTQWSGSQNAPPLPPMPPMPPMPPTPTHSRAPGHPHQRSVTGPAMPQANSQQLDWSLLYPDAEGGRRTYERNLEAFDSFYDQYGAESALVVGKRGRDGDDEGDGRDDFADGNGDYGLSPRSAADSTETRAKRLRSVASAPCLPARRMRPGPKPKSTKSPQEQHQSVFSATLSPPIPQIRRATSPYTSPLLSGGFTDDEDEGGATITYTPGPPALPGQPRSSVPKEVIQSLYSGIPSHVDKNGVKHPKRYVCLIEGCERTFPRKSAIESHIQTHLEDKPFVCPHDDCDASFVRQHDLRRHERIHSGNKPFPCPCGKGFARGDALARHRARGICSGSVVPRRI